MLGWTGDNGDPDNFLCYFFCKTGDAAAREGYFPDTEVAKLLNEAAIKSQAGGAARRYTVRQSSSSTTARCACSWLTTSPRWR